MADTANIVGKVTADTTSAVASMNKLKRAADTTGQGFAGFATSATKALDSAAVGLAKFNLALGGIQQGMRLLGGAVDLLKDAGKFRQMETQISRLGISVEGLGKAAGGTINNVDLMGFALKQLQGEGKLTQQQLELVLKASDNLGDQGFGEQIKIAEDLALAMKGGPTEALIRYGFQVDKAMKGQERINDLMRQAQNIAGETVYVDAQLKHIDRLGVAWDNFATKFRASVGLAVGDFLFSTQLEIDDMRAGIDALNRQMDAALAETAARQAKLNAGFAMAWLKANNPAAAAQLQAALQSASSGFDAGVAGVASYLPKPGATKRGRGGGARRSTTGGPEFVGFGGADALTQMNTMFSEALDDEYAPSAFQTQVAGSNSAAAAQVEEMRKALSGVGGELDAASRQVAGNDALMASNAALAVSEQAKVEAIWASTAAFQAMFQALADGQNPFQAFIKVGATLLKAEAIKNSALALSALAAGLFGLRPNGVAEAAAFARAAAANAAGAVLLGGLAGGGGGGGGSSPGSPSAGGFAGPATYGGSSQGGGVTIQVNGNLYGEPAAFGRAVVDGMDAAARSGRTRIRSGNRWS